jgi:uncharacterized protein YceK
MSIAGKYSSPNLILLTVLFLLSGCSTEIEVVDPGPPVPVVYAVFDPSDTTHYVKLSKSFAGKTDPYTLALDRNQVFYPEASITLGGGYDPGAWVFSKNSEIPRDPGYFPTQPNESFGINQLLFPGRYRLTIVIPSENKTLTADFSLLNSFRVYTPKAGFKRFYFYEDPILFTWLNDPGAGMYEITFQLRYQEVLKNGDSGIKTAVFTRQLLPSQLEPDGDRFNYRFFSDSFFAKMGTSIGSDSRINYRKPLDFSMMITAADTTLSRYLSWFNLEIDDKINPNGNVQGAIGVVASKCSVRFNNLILSGRSQDSLVRGRYTKNLEFVNNPDW